MYNFLKRIFDLAFSLIFLTIFFPFGIIISLILMLTGEGEVFYKQYRVGINGAEFGLFKFATMVKNSPNIGSGDITLKKDPRVLPFGKLLRITKLNEFPQFFNVLIGDMSIVGPRPLVKNQYRIFPAEAILKIKRLKPGITGIGSIIFRDEEKYLNNSNFDSQDFYKNQIVPYKAILESWYYDNASIRLDVLLIIATSISIFFPKLNIQKSFFSGAPKHQLFNP